MQKAQNTAQWSTSVRKCRQR